MLNRSASLAMSTSVLKALPGKLDIKRHSPSRPILYLWYVLLQVGMKYEVTASYFIALCQVVSLTPAVAVNWFERALKLSCFHRDFA